MNILELLKVLRQVLPQKRLGTTVVLVAIACAPYVKEYGQELYIFIRQNRESAAAERLKMIQKEKEEDVHDQIRAQLFYVQQTEWVTHALLLTAENIGTLDFSEPLYGSIVEEAVDEGLPLTKDDWQFETLDKYYRDLILRLRREGCLIVRREELPYNSKLFPLFVSTGTSVALICEAGQYGEKYFYTSFRSGSSKEPDATVAEYYHRKVQTIRRLLMQLRERQDKRHE